ncbi:oligosaccharide flippase family protein [Pseudonocardia nematodicida]|uniref:Oligosaccharide flippase family protein n=1 Tax=Pseudonocardia nematodicida TaxID=1206997 RepID=A0ABV1K6Q8_9PSEU
MKKTFLSASIARVLGAVAQAVMGIALARSVAPAEYGAVTALIGVFLVWFIVVDVGMSSFAGRSYALGRLDEVRTILWFSGRAALGGVVVAIAALALFVPGASGTFLAALSLLVVAQGLEKYCETRLAVVIAADLAAAVATSVLLRRLVSCSVFLLLLVAHAGPATLLYSIGMAAGAALGAVHIRRLLLRRDVPAQRSMAVGDVLRRSVPFAVNDLSIQSRALDVFLVAALTSPAGAGFYAAASKLTSPFQLLSSTLAAVVLPATARADDRDRRRLLRAIVGLTAALTVLALPVGWFGTDLSVFLLGDAYAPAGPLVAVFVVTFPVVALSTPLAALLQGMGRERFVGAQSFVSSVLLLAAVAAGAWWGDEMGAAVGFAVVAVGKYLSLALAAFVGTRAGEPSVTTLPGA